MSVHLLKAEALPALAKRANAAHHAGIDRFIEAGKALLAAKGQVEHGEWLGWIQEHLDFSAKTAQRYIRIAEADDPAAQIDKEFSKGPMPDLLTSRQVMPEEEEQAESGDDDVPDDDDDVVDWADPPKPSGPAPAIVAAMTDRQWGQLKRYEDNRRRTLMFARFASELGAERRAWLQAAIDKFRPWFAEADHELPYGPLHYRSIPVGLLRQHTYRRSGICAVAEGYICLKRDLSNTDTGDGILAVLLHELCHLVLPADTTHGKPFQELAAAVGLTGPWGSTETSPELKVRLRAIMKSLGPLPPLPRQVADEKRMMNTAPTNAAP